MKTLKIKPKVDSYGQNEFDIITREGGRLIRGGIGRYDEAKKIAEKIEESNGMELLDAKDRKERIQKEYADKPDLKDTLLRAGTYPKQQRAKGGSIKKTYW